MFQVKTPGKIEEPNPKFHPTIYSELVNFVEINQILTFFANMSAVKDFPKIFDRRNPYIIG